MAYKVILSAFFINVLFDVLLFVIVLIIKGFIVEMNISSLKNSAILHLLHLDSFQEHFLLVRLVDWQLKSFIRRTKIIGKAGRSASHFMCVYNLKCSFNREYCFSMCFMRQKSQFYRKSGNLKVGGHKNLSTHVSACIIFFKFCVKGTYFALFTNPS